MNLCDENGAPQQELFDVHTKLAKGGVGLIITGQTYVMKEDQYNKNGAGLYDDYLIPYYRQLADNAHENNAKIIIQLALVGSRSSYNTSIRDIIGPSTVPDPKSGTTPRMMTKEDINKTVIAIADAVVRTKKAGFDGVELNYAHNYVVNQFMLPYFNKRVDEYGGTIENRARYAFEIMEASRKAAGDKYPILVKMHGNDYLQAQGMDRNDPIYIAKGLKDRGATALDISGGNMITGPYPFRTNILGDTYQSYFHKDAEFISNHVDIPLILTGGNRSVSVMEQLQASNKNIKAFGLSRTLLSEPDLINTWSKDRKQTPRCVACNECLKTYGKGPSHCVFFS
jgi:2,4-dienoyl-CoA reductase-like NADH-dependent reductase (Old Yellow Enzyme family)